ncbi:MAG TPA: glycine--tRNA ligase subunit beta [Usitatibacteraceae bacterium]|nr:glycine--tRNA ligase subunit beta [Usitatibacteraceae bacterium]
MSTAPLLVELFTEELPPKALNKLGQAFAQSLGDGLARRGLLAEGPATAFATPRRLAVHLAAVRAQAPDQAVERKLMPVSVGLDADGRPSAALVKKLAALGKADADVAQLRREGEGKAAQLILCDVVRGSTLVEGLQGALEDALAALPVPKLMSYQLADGRTTVQFVRPAHALVALHGRDVVPVSVLGLSAGRITHGHRFQGAGDIVLAHADEYEQRLEKEGGVIASFKSRREEIHRMLRQRADEQDTTLGEYEDYQALLDEVSALVEMPTVYVGQFDREFLAVPAECLILTMKLNQKYFPLFLNEGGLSSRFLIVSNMRLDDPTPVVEGNERVVRPRLADARFFFETDKKTRLEARIPKLASVVYHNKLGSQADRVERVRAIARSVAAAIGAEVQHADRAALLAKADLVTDMVGEFPELQGTMGRYYALHDGEPAVVADAIAEHYQPRFAGDALPASPVALAVDIADKMETLAGLFGIGQQPTGDKDPFALRRHALGVLRMLIERQIVLPLPKLVDLAYAAFPPGLVTAAYTDLENFLFERLRGLLKDQGNSANEVEAVLGSLGAGVHVAPAVLTAVRAFTKLPEAQSLAAANKRIGNILKKADQAFANPDRERMAEPAERALFDALQAARPAFDAYFAAGNYTAALTSLAPLKGPVDTFFDEVMVNVEDPALRINRLALLGEAHALMNRVADLSKLAA